MRALDCHWGQIGLEGVFEGMGTGRQISPSGPHRFGKILVGSQDEKKTWIMGPIKKRYPLMMRLTVRHCGQIAFQGPRRWRATGGEGRDVGHTWVGLGAPQPWLGTFEAQVL